MLKYEQMKVKSVSSLLELSVENLAGLVPAMIAVYNINSGTYVFVNQAAHKLLGYTPDKIMSGGLEFLTSLVHPDDVASIAKKNQAALAAANSRVHGHNDNEPIVSFEYRMRHKNGSWVWLQTDGSIYGRNASGLVEYVINVSINITERKIAEEHLQALSHELEIRVRERSERLELAIKASQLGIWEWNIISGGLTWSDELKRIFGLNPKTDEVDYERYISMQYPADRPKMKRTIERAMKTGDGYQVEHRVIWPDGSIHWLLGQGQAFLENNRPVRMIGTTMNIDERKTAQALKAKTLLLTEEREELMALNKSKDDFIALASHQLRTPATGVKQYIGMLLSDFAGKPAPRQRELLKRAYDSNERQIKIVNDLLLVAKVDAGKVSLKKQRHDISQLIRDVVAEQVDILRLRGQKVRLHLPDKLPAIVDAFYLRTVIENLLNNASKYSPEGKQILVSAKLKAKEIQIAIQDHGIGIRHQDQSKLFRKFTRIDNDKAEAVDGNGLGLYWSKKIIDLHDGNLALVSRIGYGSTFTITLPANVLAHLT